LVLGEIDSPFAKAISLKKKIIGEISLSNGSRRRIYIYSFFIW